MTTRWDGAQLNGSKDFVTTGDAVQWLLVSAREEGADESPRLGLFAVEPTAAGVALTPGPSLPIVPDIPHARLQLAGAPAKRLAGDGWSDYVKPFRTHEDLHVLAALTAWLYGVALRERGRATCSFVCWQSWAARRKWPDCQPTSPPRTSCWPPSSSSSLRCKGTRLGHGSRRCGGALAARSRRAGAGARCTGAPPGAGLPRARAGLKACWWELCLPVASL